MGPYFLSTIRISPRDEWVLNDFNWLFSLMFISIFHSSSKPFLFCFRTETLSCISPRGERVLKLFWAIFQFYIKQFSIHLYDSFDVNLLLTVILSCLEIRLKAIFTDSPVRYFLLCTKLAHVLVWHRVALSRFHPTSKSHARSQLMLHLTRSSLALVSGHMQPLQALATHFERPSRVWHCSWDYKEFPSILFTRQMIVR